MAIKLGENNYGKSRVRLLRVVRQDGRHDIRELTLGFRSKEISRPRTRKATIAKFCRRTR